MTPGRSHRPLNQEGGASGKGGTRTLDPSGRLTRNSHGRGKTGSARWTRVLGPGCDHQGRPALPLCAQTGTVAPVATLPSLSSVNAFIPVALFSVFTGVAEAGDPARYSTRVEEWVAVPVPSRADLADYAVWSYASNYSGYEWRVTVREGVTAQLTHRERDDGSLGLPFTPRAENFAGASSAIHVPDGWLVAFNHGEFGAALYWFDETGEHNYKVSDNQVVAFVQLPDRLVAVDGIDHMTMSRGSIIRLERSKNQGRWTVYTVAPLPFAPYAAVAQRDGRIVIVLSDALVRATANGELQTLLSDVPWSQLFPNSAVMNPDETRVYIGMRQYVAEVDLTTRKLRMLVPSAAFLNKLPRDQEQRIRKQSGG